VKTLGLLAILLTAAAGPAFAQSLPVKGHDMNDMADMADMPGMGPGDHMTMGRMAALSDTPMTREASGTAWQPDTARHDGWMTMRPDGWMTMVHGDMTLVADRQSGPRGDDKAFVSGMLMASAGHDLGPARVTFRLMVSPDPFIGKGGYPKLFQTGETADGVHGLVDRQHPHDGVGELAVMVSAPLLAGVSGFVYAGYPGEPALGPVAFLHRGSGGDNPSAPISHHWLDSTHVAYGVATAGLVSGPFKLDASTFTGREPDQYRWAFDRPRFDSRSVRVTFNPAREWSMQVSRGWIVSPEQLSPDENVTRTTASVSHSLPVVSSLLGDALWQSTVAWGRNRFTDGRTRDAWLAEASLSFGPNVVFARAERADKDELFRPPSPLAGRSFRVGELSAGYVRYIPVAPHLTVGVGGVGGLYAYPDALRAAYGSRPAELMGFVRFKIT
jgi:hypothetical protein